MLNIMIVEDEKIEREALFRLIKENLASTFSDIYTVDNGEDAYRIFCEQKCDIVLSDINIPKMSGLELVRKIKERVPSTKCLILTSYNYFEYVQESLRLGVDDFILKPSKNIEILESVRKAIRNYSESDKKSNLMISDEIYSILESDCVYALLMNEPIQRISFFFNVLNVKMKYGVCICFKKEYVNSEKMKNKINQHKSESLSILCEPYIDNYIMFLFYDKVMTINRLKYTKSVLLGCMMEEAQIGLGNIKENIEDLHYSFLEATNKLNNMEVFRNHHNLKDDNVSIEEFVNTIIINVKRGIKNQNMDMIVKLSEKSYRYIIRNQKSVHEFLELFVIRLKEIMEPDAVFEISSLVLSEVINKKDEKIYMTYIMRNTIVYYMKKQGNNMNKLVIDSYQYIRKNYNKSIALNDLAKYLNVTPQYISSLLSKIENNNFTNLLSEYRIEKAKELLKENINIKEIAVMVGFQNHNYFTNIFKKKTGYTPKEFIKQKDVW